MYLPRVGLHDSRAIEQALAGPTLFEQGVDLEGGVVEASYATKEPPLLKRLREEQVPLICDLQTLRFASPTFLETEAIASLPYAPREPITCSATDEDLRTLARDSLLFQQRIGAARYLAPALPVLDVDLDDWMRLNRELLYATAHANGGPDVDRRPLAAVVAPGRRALAEPQLFTDWLFDLPIDTVYVQPLNLRPTRDGLEKLAQYVRFLAALRSAGLAVIAGRVGAFGLLLCAIEVADAFDSGLGDAEAYSYSQAIRAPKKPQATPGESPSGGRDRRIYIEMLKTTLPSKWATPILAEPKLRTRFTCTLGCCARTGFDGLTKRRRQHYLWTRCNEVDQIRRKPTPQMRVFHIHDGLVDARDHASVVARALAAQGLEAPDFAHLDRWLSLLARETTASAVA
jgi:hypothetical protein